MVKKVNKSIKVSPSKDKEDLSTPSPKAKSLEMTNKKAVSDNKKTEIPTKDLSNKKLVKSSGGKDKKDQKKVKKEDVPKSKIVKKKKKKKSQRQVPRGRVYITSTYNNTLVTITDLEGNVIAWGSAGSSGFKGARRGTPYAATVTAQNTCEKVQKFGFSEADVFVKGIGSGRESAIRALHSSGIEISLIKDVTPLAHGGCRPKKVRRV